MAKYDRILPDEGVASVPYKPDGLCVLCRRPFQPGDKADTACQQCSNESVDRVLAPFLVLRQKQDTESTEEVRRTKAVLYHTGRNPEKDPAWIKLRRAAKSRWPDLNEKDDDTVVAIRVEKWIDEQRSLIVELQRPLVPVSTIVTMLADKAVKGSKETKKTNSSSDELLDANVIRKVGTFRVTAKHVTVEGLDEALVLENMKGVQRLIRIVTARPHRANAIELARIGSVAKASKRANDDHNTDSLSVVQPQYSGNERALDIDTLPQVRDALNKLFEQRDVAKENGDKERANVLTKKINATLEQCKSQSQTASHNVQKTLNTAYRAMKAAGGHRLAKHFETYIQRQRKDPDFVYSPPESEKIEWTQI